MNIQHNYFEGNISGDGEDFYSHGYDGEINVSNSIFDNIDCDQNSVNEFVLRSKQMRQFIFRKIYQEIVLNLMNTLLVQRADMMTILALNMNQC